MSAPIETIRDTYTKIPEMGREATRRIIPGAQLRRYFDSLQAAYESAGLKPPTGGSLVPQKEVPVPTLKEEYEQFQVALAFNGDGSSAARYYSTGLLLMSGAHASILRQGDTFVGSSGFALPERTGYHRKPEEEGFTFEFTRGQDGSLRMLSDFVMEKADAGLFVPAEPSIILTDRMSWQV